MANTKRAPAEEARYTDALAAFGPALLRLARGYEADPERRRDLHQEMLVALWRALPGFEERSSLRTFVLRVGHNVGATWVTRERRSRASGWVTLEGLEARPAPGHGEGALEARERIDHLAALVRALRPVDRQVLLSWLDGLEPDEIAELTGLSPTNVTTKVHRVRAVLRARIDDGRMR
jgi:RNA polymerase sigma-70 factor (ECF subfamily)